MIGVEYAHTDAAHFALYALLTVFVLCVIGVVIIGLLKWPYEERQHEEIDEHQDHPGI